MLTMRSSADDVRMTYMPADNVRTTYMPADDMWMTYLPVDDICHPPAKSPTKSHSCVICMLSTRRLHEISTPKIFPLRADSSAKNTNKNGVVFLHSYSCFSDFVFKIRLIKLGFSIKKLKFPVLYLNSYWFQSRVIIITPTEPTVSERHRKAFSTLQSCMTDSSWIHLILLIQLI